MKFPIFKRFCRQSPQINYVDFKQGSTVDDEVGNIMRNGPGAGSNAGQAEGKFLLRLSPLKIV